MEDDDLGLGVAQIVITAATPMIEEPEQPFPPPSEEMVNHTPEHTKDESTILEEEEEEEPEPEQEDKEIDAIVEDVEEKSVTDDMPTDSAPFPVSSSPSQDIWNPEITFIDWFLSRAIILLSFGRFRVVKCCFQVSSSTGSEGDTTGPSTAENSQSNAAPAPATATDSSEEPKQVVGGRASIPDELEPHQLARLQDLKESNA